MKYFGTVSSFDTGNGHGEIKPETGGDMLRFERSAFSWENNAVPTVGQRLSYDVGTNPQRQPCALNLQTI
jgi:cold shock CspA family protein